MNQKPRVQIIESFFDGVISTLKSMGIVVENYVHAQSPLSMAGDVDPKYIDLLSDDPDILMLDLLWIRKNLANMLSRFADAFCQNYNKQPPDVEVRSANTSNYLVFTNGTSELPIYKKGSIVYYHMMSDIINAAFKDDKAWTLFRSATLKSPMTA